LFKKGHRLWRTHRQSVVLLPLPTRFKGMAKVEVVLITLPEIWSVTTNSILCLIVHSIIVRPTPGVSAMPPPRIGQQKSCAQSLSSTHLVVLSFAVQVGLLIYANHVDSNPEKYGGLRYTDVDWRVVSDGAKLIFGGGGNSSGGGGTVDTGLHAGEGSLGGGIGKRAEGWFINDTGLPVGE
jgi:uncharacterized membrane protein YgcG